MVINTAIKLITSHGITVFINSETATIGKGLGSSVRAMKKGNVV